MRIFTINPGSTSTKVALFEDGKLILSENIAHDASELEKFETIPEQMPYREQVIWEFLDRHQVDLSQIDAYVGRGGGLISMEGGVYEIDDLLERDALYGANGVQHPAMLGPALARKFARSYGKPAYVVNPPDVDELQDVARITGVKGVYRTIHLHALNLKETAIRHAMQQNENYETSNYIVCHIGGGISVSAHRNGKMIDGNDIAGGEGPMAPTRCGSLSVAELLKCCEQMSVGEVASLCTKKGGLVSWLGTSDAREVSRRAEAGDALAGTIWNAMIYQITKAIGSMAAVLEGNVNAILLGGGMVYNSQLVEKIKAACSFLAPVYAYPGEYEMEAMDAGARRVLNGAEKAKRYTGKPVWAGLQL